MNSHLIEFFHIIHLNKWDTDKDKITTSIKRNTSIHKWLIKIYATRGISAWKSYNKTRQEYVALMDLQCTKETKLTFFKAEMYFCVKSQ